MAGRWWVSGLRIAGTLVACLCAPPAQASGQWSLVGFTGVMTNNQWEQSIIPWEVELLDSGLVGLGLRRDWPVGSAGRFRLGVEGQIVQHFGEQSHLEVNMQVVGSYLPQSGWLEPLDRFSFGLGLSYATDLPETELARDGETQRVLIYWMGELGFDISTDTELLFRLHHRSDGFGLLDANAGSNVLAVGLRRAF